MTAGHPTTKVISRCLSRAGPARAVGKRPQRTHAKAAIPVCRYRDWYQCSSPLRAERGFCRTTGLPWDFTAHASNTVEAPAVKQTAAIRPGRPDGRIWAARALPPQYHRADAHCPATQLTTGQHQLSGNERRPGIR
jgi:hypothetical protein